jgi:YHS domain-containing protein
MVEDPVCGLELEEDQVAARTEYDGQTYCFCSEECLAEFETEPFRYVESAPIEYQL